MAAPPDLNLLHDWLRTHAPRDILIPCPLNTKRPTVKYGGGVWTWGSFDDFREKNSPGSTDWSVGLRDLCVVDLDASELAPDLEARFPLLRTAPCERTRRGFHYFFRRSTLANVGCFYDGCGQVTPHLDFKSLCSTGTPGIIVVTPSTDKTWVRAPWDCKIVEIPDDLLKLVARPNAALASGDAHVDAPSLTGSLQPSPATTELLEVLPPPEGLAPPPLLLEAVPAVPAEVLRGVLLAFPDDAVTHRAPLRLAPPRTRLARFEYFAAPLAAGFDAFAIPVERGVFVALLAVVETGDVPHLVPPTDALLLALHAAALALGADAAALRTLLPPASPTTRLPYRADLYALRPSWWRADAEEESRMARGESSDVALVRVDAALAAKLRYTPIKKAEGGVWLFPSQPHLVKLEQAGLPVLVHDPPHSLTAALPKLVAALLRAHPDNMVLAGGAITGACSQVVPAGADFDLFLHSATPEEADVLMARTRAAAAKAGYTEIVSTCAVTFFAPAGGAGDAAKPFQLILGLHRDRAQVLESFDLAPCKALARFVKADLVIEALPAWTEALRAMAFWVDTTAWSAAAVARITKYIGKGFECAVPGTRSQALAGRTLAPRWYSSAPPQACPDARRDIKGGDFTIAALFDAEAGHTYATLGEGSGGEHYSWPTGPGIDHRDWRVLKKNPARLGVAGAAAIAAALVGAPELDVDDSKITSPWRTRKSPGLFGSGYGSQFRHTYKFFWSPALREGHATAGALAERDAAVAALFETGIKGGADDTIEAATAAVAKVRGTQRSGSSGASGGDPVGSAVATEIPWQTVRGVARFAPLDAALSALHDPAKLLVAAEAEGAQRAARSAGGREVSTDCAECGRPGSTFVCGGCHSLYYCAAACQQKGWPAHKAPCKALQAGANWQAVSLWGKAAAQAKARKGPAA